MNGRKHQKSENVCRECERELCMMMNWKKVGIGLYFASIMRGQASDLI